MFASKGSAKEEKSSRKWKHIEQYLLSMHIGQLRVSCPLRSRLVHDLLSTAVGDAGVMQSKTQVWAGRWAWAFGNSFLLNYFFQVPE